MNLKPSVVLYEESANEAHFYSNLIQQTVFCKLTLVTEKEGLLEAVEGLDHPLVVISHRNQCFDLLKVVKRAAPTAMVILVSGLASIEEAVRVMKVGAEDYFALPLKIDLFKKSIKNTIEKSSFGNLYSIEFVDDVTGLYNIRYLKAILNHEIRTSQINRRTFAILFIDADQFKSVNDAYGHIIGTKLLNELGSCLKKYVREKDVVCRYGGDEFVAVLGSCDLITAKIVSERIKNAVEKNIFLKDDQMNIHVTISVGIALFPDQATTQNELIEVADRDMYKSKYAKRRGKFGGGSKVNSSSI